MHIILHLIVQSLTITLVVLLLMLIVEYLNVLSGGRWLQHLSDRKGFQLLLATLFGLLPGCAGSYFWVTLYTHGTVTFGSLLANFIATTGDESFFMLGLVPKSMLILSSILFLLALLVGFIFDRFFPQRIDIPFKHIEVHDHDLFHLQGYVKCCTINFRKLTFERLFIIFVLLLLSLWLLFGPGHQHTLGDKFHGIQIEGFIRILLAILSVVAILITLAVNEHFLKEHVWNHVFKKHFFRLFFWILATMIVLYMLFQWLDVKDWVASNVPLMMLLAALVGIAPQSGPHMIFVTMYATGIIPLPVLFVNSVVQDGHAGLPLLAESPRAFLAVKAIKLVVALGVGFLMLWIMS